MVSAEFFDQRKGLFAASGGGVASRFEELVGGAAHGRDDHDGAAVFVAANDGGDAGNGFLRFDGAAAELHDDHEWVGARLEGFMGRGGGVRGRACLIGLRRVATSPGRGVPEKLGKCSAGRHALKEAFRDDQFRVKHSSAGSAANGVVGAGDEL